MSYPISINDLAERINKTAHDKGWWTEPRSFGDIVALCHSELSEALEEHRNGKAMMYYNESAMYEVPKPEGIAVEMVDCMIRILDYLEENHINVEQVMVTKMAYNETRPYRHGGKAL